jgi:hypothetical protein
MNILCDLLGPGVGFFQEAIEAMFVVLNLIGIDTPDFAGFIGGIFGCTF